MQANRFWFKHLVIIPVLFLIFTSCVEEYWPELNTTTGQFLVVDGKISNLPGPYTVKLSGSSSQLDTAYIPKTSATITIVDDQGNQEILQEKNPGIYKTNADGIQGIIGRSYKIKIELKDGNVYESAYDELLNPVGVSEVFHETEWQYARNELETDQEGFQFYVSSEQAETLDTYFYWEIEETFEYHSANYTYFFYDGTISSEGISNFYGIKEMNNIDSLYYCWKTRQLTELFSYSLNNLSLAEAKKQPLHFLTHSDERLRYGYNILVKQYTVSEETYNFLHLIKKQNENQGDIFSSQPFPIRGNVKNIHDQSEEVLGYFMVAGGATGPRIQVKAPGGIRYEDAVCYATTSESYIHNRIVNSSASDWPIYFTYFFFEFGEPPGTFFAYVEQECLDCTKHGGVPLKPYFWE